MLLLEVFNVVCTRPGLPPNLGVIAIGGSPNLQEAMEAILSRVRLGDLKPHTFYILPEKFTFNPLDDGDKFFNYLNHRYELKNEFISTITYVVREDIRLLKPDTTKPYQIVFIVKGLVELITNSPKQERTKVSKVNSLEEAEFRENKSRK